MTGAEQRDPQPAEGRRGDSGLTTLEWLLIVAAVAGLAALAVVLVQRVVSDTSEQIAGNSARQTAAKVSGAQITDKAKAALADPDLDDAEVHDKYRLECRRLLVLYADADITAKYTDADGCVVDASGTAAAPAAPTAVAYVETTGVLSWTAPAGTVTGYSITCAGAACPGTSWDPGTAIQHIVGMPPGSATAGDTAVFSVTATNGDGTGTAGTATYTVP